MSRLTHEVGPQTALTKSDKLLSVGVDYITATEVGPPQRSRLADFGRWLVHQEALRGERERNFGFSGYRGLHAGSASFGRRYDGAIVRLSSRVAAEHWNQLYSLSTNVSRLDIQATAFPWEGPQGRLSKHHAELRRKEQKRGRPGNFKVWYGYDGPEACAIGRRTSDWFLRVYDKGIETQLPEFFGTLRYEVELKRHVAVETAMQLDHSDSPDLVILAKLGKFAANRRLRSVAALFERAAAEQDGRSSSENLSGNYETTNSPENFPSDPFIMLGEGTWRKRAIWLRNAVRPSIQALLDHGQEEIVLEALGLSEASKLIPRKDKGLWSDFDKQRR